MSQPQTPTVDPRTLCIICKQGPSASRPGATYEGQGENAMIVRFFVHDGCRPLLDVRRGVDPL